MTTIGVLTDLTLEEGLLQFLTVGSDYSNQRSHRGQAHGAVLCCKTTQHRRNRLPDQMVAKFVAELRKLIMNCEFGVALDEVL